MGRDLGERITSCLKEQGMSQRGLAERISVSPDVMSRYISGSREPKPDTLANIATALHTTSDYLLGIEHDDFDYPKIRRMIARNSQGMTNEEKKALVIALFGEE